MWRGKKHKFQKQNDVHVCAVNRMEDIQKLNQACTIKIQAVCATWATNELIMAYISNQETKNLNTLTTSLTKKYSNPSWYGSL